MTAPSPILQDLNALGVPRLYTDPITGLVTGFYKPSGAILPLLGTNRILVPTSRSIVVSDFEQRLDVANGVTIVLPYDAAQGLTGAVVWPTIAFYTAGVSMTRDFSAVTMRNTAPPITQYSLWGITRVGVNEWAYL